MTRVFADTNVLFPFSIMDLLLALTEDMVHEIIWTERLLAEWQRVIVREQRRSPASAEAIACAIREYFPEGRVPEQQYAHLSSNMPGEDSDDRHHMAAALMGRAHLILTWNLADFPQAPLAELGLRVTDPDTYLCELFEELPDEVIGTVVRMAAEKRRTPKTPEDLAGVLNKAGVPEFAERLRLRVANDS